MFKERNRSYGVLFTKALFHDVIALILGCQCSIVCFSVDAGGGDGINTLHNLANNTTLEISPREYWIKRILITKKAFRFVILNTEMWCNDKTY